MNRTNFPGTILCNEEVTLTSVTPRVPPHVRSVVCE